MKRSGYRLALVTLFVAGLLLSACAMPANEAAEQGADAWYPYSEIQTIADAVWNIAEEEPADTACLELEKTLLDDSDEANIPTNGNVAAWMDPDRNSLEGIPSADFHPGAYTSSRSDGAVLTAADDGGFRYQMARRYQFVGEPSFAFDLVLRASGRLQGEGSRFRLLLDDVTLSCTSLTNSSEAERLLAQNILYSEYGLEWNERLIAGQELSIDEFLSSDTLAKSVLAPIYVTLDPANWKFTLDEPLLAGWLNGNSTGDA